MVVVLRTSTLMLKWKLKLIFRIMADGSVINKRYELSSSSSAIAVAVRTANGIPHAAIIVKQQLSGIVVQKFPLGKYSLA